jgi:RNA polymerase primary sigma factor
MRQLKITKQITNRDAKSLEKYFQEISKIDLITAHEEVDLARRIRQGDQKAVDKLVSANLRFVVSAAKQYQNRGLRLTDLINEGNLGLVKAAKRFDETRGFKFISYAVWWIRQSILQALSNTSRVIRLPQNKIATNTKIYQVYSTLEQTYQRPPSPSEIASELDISVSKVKSSIKSSVKHISLDAPFKEGESSSYMLF